MDRCNTAASTGGKGKKCSLAILLSLVDGLSCSLLGSKIFTDAVQVGDNDKMVNKLKTTLLLIKGVANDAEDKQVKNEAVRMWLNELKDVAYDAEDVLDEFATKVLSVRLDSKSLNRSTQVWNLFPTSLSPSTMMFNSKINEVIERLDTLANKRQELGLSEVVAGSSCKIKETSSLVNESCVFGRDKDKEKIMELLMVENMPSCESEVSVIPIVGMPGVGKTTLAQVLFNDRRVSMHFDVKAWVSVSNEFDVKTVTRKILEAATSRRCNFNELSLLQDELKAALEGKKFLVVLDDVWNENYHEWMNLKTLLKGRVRGSWVVVTTRNARVARVMGTVEAHSLDLLPEDECWSVFAHHAFKIKITGTNPTLVEIGKKIAKKCKGLPLAASTLGGILCSNKDEKEWETVLNSETLDLAVEKSDILETLRLSYCHLPSHLKRCFAYCSLLPKGYEFEEKDLVLLWMAEGFLQQLGQKEMEDSGYKYFQDLLSMSFFQKSSRKRSWYVMHDLVNDLAQWVAGETCFKLDNRLHLQEQKRQKISKTARHSSYVGGEYDNIQMFQALYETKLVRTFLPLKHGSQEQAYIANDVPFKLLPKLTSLRVLSLSGYYISKLPDSVCNLKQLRYLNLSHTIIRKLPESVSKLCNLQTLLLKDCFDLEMLPSKMGDLINLRHLDITGALSLTGMPEGIGKLTHLQTLSNFILGKSSIRELMNLSNLQGVLSVSRLECLVDDREASEAMLIKKTGIDVLKLKWSSCTTVMSHIGRAKVVLHMLQPQRALKKLSVECYAGSSFPKWVEDPSFKCLVSLKLKNCANCTSLPALGNLHALKDLHVIGMKEVCCIDGGFYGEGCSRPFPSLERLSFRDMNKWIDWFPSVDKQLDTFPCLLELSVVRCPKLRGNLPDRLPCLKALLIKECEQLIVPISCFPLLCKLEIEACKGIVLNSETEFSSLNSMALSRIFEFTSPIEWFLQGFRGVEELKIVDCDQEVITALWGNHVYLEKYAHFSFKLRAIEIRNCSVLKIVPESLILHSPCLERLYICNCDSLIFVTRDQLPPTLKSLEISNCKSLRCLVDNGECSSMMLEENSHRGGKDISLLEYVYISWCPSLTCLSSSGELPGAIKLLSICNCSELTCLSLEGQLPTTLKKLEIQSCPKLDSIARSFHRNTSLESIQIWDCENLKSLPQGIDCLMHLEEIKIIGCPSLISFPEGSLPTSNLKELCIMRCERLEPLPNFMHNLTSLKKLEIGHCPSIKVFPQEGFPPNLTSLWINGHNACEALFDSGLYKLIFLKDLTLIGGNLHIPLEEVCSMLPFSLTSFTIQEFPNLKLMSSKGFHNLTSLSSLALRDLLNLEYLPSNGFQDLISLQELSIYNCPKLFCLPEEGLPSSLLKLYIQGCPRLKKQYRKGKGKEWFKIANIPCVEIDGEFIHD